MSGHNEQFEREFEAFLNEEDSRLAALYRKLPRPEPEAKLDAAVLAMARRAQTSSPRARARGPRWLPALSAAAVVMLAAGVAFRLGPTVWQERDARPLQKAANENAAAPVVAAPQNAAAKTQPLDSDAFKDKAAKPAAAPATPAASAPAAAADTGDTPRQEVFARSRKLEPAARRVDAPTAQAFPAQVPVEQEKKAEVSAANAVDATRTQSGAASERQMLDSKRDEQTAQPEGVLKMREEHAPMPAATPPPSAPAAPVPLPMESAPAAAAATSAAGAAAAKSALAAPKPLRSKDPNAKLYPEHWLANIRAMLRDNRREQALRSLAEFRKIYPDYHLPDDLRDLK